MKNSAKQINCFLTSDHSMEDLRVKSYTLFFKRHKIHF